MRHGYGMDAESITLFPMIDLMTQLILTIISRHCQFDYDLLSFYTSSFAFDHAYPTF